MRHIDTMEAALAAVQEHLAGPLGARARLQGRGPSQGALFEYGGNTVGVWFDQGASERPPVWVRVTVGPARRLYRTAEGLVPAEPGSSGLSSSTLFVSSDEDLVAVLQGAQAAIRKTTRGRSKRATVLNSADKLLRLVQKELAGPLGGTAAPDPADAAALVVTLPERQLHLQFSRDLAQGAQEWVRIACADQLAQFYLVSRPEGYLYAHPRNRRGPGEITHSLNTYGDALEVLRAARAALEAGRMEARRPTVFPKVVLDTVQESFAAALGLEGATVAGKVSGESALTVSVRCDGFVTYTITLDPAFAEEGYPGRWAELHLQPEEAGELTLVDRGDRYALQTGAEAGEARLEVEGLDGLGAVLSSCAAYLIRLQGEARTPPPAAAAAAVTEVEVPAAAQVEPLSDAFWTAHLAAPLHTRTVLRRIRRELSARRWFRKATVAEVLTLARKELGMTVPVFAEGEVAGPLAVAAAVWGRKVYGLPAILAVSLGRFVGAWAGSMPAWPDDDGDGPEAEAMAELKARCGARRSLTPWETDRFLQHAVALYRSAAAQIE